VWGHSFKMILTVFPAHSFVENNSERAGVGHNRTQRRANNAKVRAVTAGGEDASTARESGAEATALQTLREELGVGGLSCNGLAVEKRQGWRTPGRWRVRRARN